jgi:hypothetical protein
MSLKFLVGWLCSVVDGFLHIMWSLSTCGQVEAVTILVFFHLSLCHPVCDLVYLYDAALLNCSQQPRIGTEASDFYNKQAQEIKQESGTPL